MKRKTIVDIIAYLFILLFVYASVNKLADYRAFSIELGKSPLLTAFADWVAWGVPVVELVVVALLTVPRWCLAGLYAAFSLMTMFTAYIVAILKFSDYIPCSCGGVLQNMTWNQHLVFNIFFVVLGFVGIMLYEKEAPKDKAPLQPAV
ncbi:MauE/DoxX family redox-associated membrane protein [Chitinophaga japonensis]|uniref:Methylamine utilisation protein MauE domain-containing protein n=1 Tax=Chitinophaga japonensis TaxID=104662 RepID=A0A562TDE9_CHIJA|nr:MauE/DoxX family redox-associated membrane protein [Chitinophaga japonensis]TWI91284.1 hypothetical protein LX66_0649 [Chitinophaga japonensis]